MTARYPNRPKRTEKQLKDFWRRAKIKATFDVSASKRSAKQTGGGGGGPKDTELSADDNRHDWRRRNKPTT